MAMWKVEWRELDDPIQASTLQHPVSSACPDSRQTPPSNPIHHAYIVVCAWRVHFVLQQILICKLFYCGKYWHQTKWENKKKIKVFSRKKIRSRSCSIMRVRRNRTNGIATKIAATLLEPNHIGILNKESELHRTNLKQSELQDKKNCTRNCSACSLCAQFCTLHNNQHMLCMPSSNSKLHIPRLYKDNQTMSH